MSPRLPFIHLNLRCNPFRELNSADWTDLADVDVGRFTRLVEQPNAALQFVGDKGHGKTTHLLALKAHYPACGYVHIPEGERRRIPSGDPILIDEAQRLTFRQQLSVFRAKVPLILGTHRDFGWLLQLCGRTVHTFHVSEDMTAERLHQIVHRRIEAARRQPGPIPSVSLQTASRLLDTHGPDVRSILHQLYETFQELPDVKTI